MDSYFYYILYGSITGCIFILLRRINVINSFITFINLLSSIAKIIIPESTSEKSELHSNNNIVIINTFFEEKKDQQTFTVRTIKTKHLLSVVGVRNKGEEEYTAGDDNLNSAEIEEPIEIGHVMSHYFGLDITPAYLGYEKFILTINYYLGKGAMFSIEIPSNVTIFDFISNNHHILENSTITKAPVVANETEIGSDDQN